VTAVLNQEIKSFVSIEYPLSGNRRTLTAKETTSITAKIIVSRLSKEILTSVPPLGRYLLPSNKKLFPKMTFRL
jgi:hypothetical protein